MSRLLPLVLAATGAIVPAFSQSTPFTILVDVRGQVSSVSNLSTTTMVAGAVGTKVKATITLVYAGAKQATISSLPLAIGSDRFSIASTESLPAVLDPQSSYKFTLTYDAVTPSTVTSQIIASYSETGSAPGELRLNFVGSTADVVVSYVFSANGNIVPIADGGQIPFPSTARGASTLATIQIANRGQVAALLESVTISGDKFSLQSLPLLPTNIASNGSVPFGVRYSPTQIGTDTGLLSLKIGDKTSNIVLLGTSEDAVLIYELSRESTTIPLDPAAITTLPGLAAGSTVRYTVRATNHGNADGVISNITATGSGYSLSDVAFLPTTIHPGGSTTFQLVVSATQPGALPGRLRIGNDNFQLAVNVMGGTFSFSTPTGSTTSSILFSPLPISESSTIRFTITNTGNAVATITSIGLSAQPFYRLGPLPSLPLSLAPSESTSFDIIYVPTVVGQATATLLIDGQAFTISGFGEEPSQRPSYQLTGPTNPVAPFTQPVIGLSLREAYPLDVVGTLVMTIVSDSFSADPAVLFSSGDRTVDFVIPANTTNAIFPNGSTTVRLQTGTVAGTIQIAPTFRTVTTTDLTPLTGDVLRLDIPRAAPTLLSAQAGATSNGFAIVVSGFTTTRSLTRLDFEFTGARGVKLAQNRFSVDVSNPANLWFQSSTSQSFGGQFSVGVPFSVQFSSTVQAITDLLQSVTVTAVNDVGKSNPLSSAIK